MMASWRHEAIIIYISSTTTTITQMMATMIARTYGQLTPPVIGVTGRWSSLAAAMRRCSGCGRMASSLVIRAKRDRCRIGKSHLVRTLARINRRADRI